MTGGAGTYQATEAATTASIGRAIWDHLVREFKNLRAAYIRFRKDFFTRPREEARLNERIREFERLREQAQKNVKRADYVIRRGEGQARTVLRKVGTEVHEIETDAEGTIIRTVVRLVRGGQVFRP